MAKIKIEDGSGDKDFFTIIPNYIKNHSTANDQSLYLQMKGFAGEEGKCFATEKTLMERMGVGKKAFNKSLNYLLEKKWIDKKHCLGCHTSIESDVCVSSQLKIISAVAVAVKSTRLIWP